MSAMRSRFLIRFLAFGLCCLLTGLACAGCGPGVPSEPSGEETYLYAPELTEEELAAVTSENLLLANKQHPVEHSYAPTLSALPQDAIIHHDSIQMEKTAALALLAMLKGMRADGIRDTYVTSGYRSYAYQEQLFSYYVSQEKQNNPSLTDAQAEAIVLTYSAKPGTSEHQTGLCADFMTETMSELDNSFERSRAFEWLSENAAKYGFILRYPNGREDVTGYAYESWHYRFVGRKAAIAIRKAGLTLEEYLESAG